MRLLYFWKWCSWEVSWPFGKPECGRLILETLSLLSHSGPCEQFQGLAPGWASMIRGLKKKGVLKWKRGAEVLFSQAGSMPDKLPFTAPESSLSFRTSSLGVAFQGSGMLGVILREFGPVGSQEAGPELGLGYRLTWTTEGSLCRVLPASE